LKYRVERKSIIVTCPKCGREGILRRHGYSLFGYRYAVVHRVGDREEWCYFPPVSEEENNRLLNEIWHEVRVRRRKV
jgi:hypothetical protein